MSGVGPQACRRLNGRSIVPKKLVFPGCLVWLQTLGVTAVWLLVEKEGKYRGLFNIPCYTGDRTGERHVRGGTDFSTNRHRVNIRI
jgi:hypothetical protein